ncbi:MAG: VOC family protein [bacterium]
MDNRFLHFGIKCSDLDESLKFYVDVMGFKKLYELQVMGNPCIFVGNETVEIELERANSNEAPPKNPVMFGMGHFAIEVEDIDAKAKELAARGAQFMMPPFQIRPTRKIAFIKATDGVLIQLIQDFPET